MAEGRVAVFQKLKPPCVALSQVALAYRVQKATNHDIVKGLRNVHQVLEAVDELDVKLAEYVFFPLSCVFREIVALPSEATELSLKCLDILIHKGWRQATNVDLCKELIILLSFIFGRAAPEDRSTHTFNENAVALALDCFTSLVIDASALFLRFCKSSQDKIAPVLGHAINSALVILKEDPSHKTQLTAVGTISSTISCLRYEKILVDFLPGIISSLTKAIEPTTQSRRSYKVIVQVLQALELIMGNVLSDRLPNHATAEGGYTVSEARSKPWVEATSGQVNLALAKISRLQNHEKEDVRQALFKLCITVLLDCKATLKGSTAMLLETATILCSSVDEFDWQAEKRNLKEAMQADPHLAHHIKSWLHTLISSLPAMLQTSDLGILRKHMVLISFIYVITYDSSVDVGLLDETLLSSLQESVGMLLGNAPLSKRTQDLASISDYSTIASTARVSTTPPNNNVQLDYMQELIKTLVSHQSQLSIKRRLVEALITKSSRDKVASMWLMTRFMTPEKEIQSKEPLESSRLEDLCETTFWEIAYPSALDILSVSPAESTDDWRYQAVALEVIAFYAQYQMTNFQPELVDALFPVIERIGVAEAGLRQHAFACLNILAQVCGASSAADLVVQNSDYLINSLAMKLNAFDISPLTPKILVTMIELCGPKLIPYLDDILDPVFSALAMFHGYPTLVDGMFAVLESIVKQSAGSLSNSLESSRGESGKDFYRPITIEQAINLIEISKPLSMGGLRPEYDTEKERESSSQGFGDESTKIEENGLAQLDHGEERHGSKKQRHVRKTYEMVQSIVRLGQHYLTHSSPGFRMRLLNLLRTGFSILASNEDDFLPLINDIWQVTMKRLFDPEPEVCIAATETLCSVFKAAGDFVSTRVEDEWPRIIKLGNEVYQKYMLENKGRGGRGIFTPASRQWDALVEFFTVLVQQLRITAEMEDQVMQLLEPPSRNRPEVRAVLEKLNGDALWLLQEKQRQATERESTPLRCPSPKELGFSVIDTSKL